MVSLVSKWKLATTACKNVIKSLEHRGLSTETMPNVNYESKELVIKYLDGKDNGIVVLGLNRPESRNAFGRNLVGQMFEALSSIRDNDKIRVLVLQSLVPKIFCSGADLRERSKMRENEVGDFVTSLRTMMREFEGLPAPSIAAIDGFALGGGLELALAADIRTASSEAKMGLVETKLAIIPGAGGTQRLPRLVGTAKAKELIYTARVIDGKQAEGMGLVNQAVPQNKNGDAAYQAALAIAREILPNGPVGVRMAKTAITKGVEVSIENGYEIEKNCYAELLKTEDRIEGLAAFASKRVPIYRGV